MKLRTLQTSSAVGLAALALLTASALIVSTTVLARESRRLEQVIASVRAAEELEIALLLHNRESTMYALRRDDPLAGPSHARARERAEASLRRWLADAERHVGTAEEGRLLETVSGRAVAYLDARRQVDEAGLPALAAYERVTPALEAAFQSMEALLAVNLEQARAARARADALDRLANAAGTAVAVLLMVIVGALLLVMRRNVYAPLFQTREAIARFAGGEPAARAPDRGPPELREISSTFNDMAETIGRQRRQLLAFLAGVAHDMRNPIGALKLGVERLAPDRPLPDEGRLRATLALVARQVDRIDRMLGDLLDAARIEAGALELRREPLDVRAVAREAVELFDPVAKLHQLVVELPDTEVAVLADRTRLEQVLNNLISNAIKYSPAGGDVRIGVARIGDEAVITVADQGIGIPPAEQARVFEPFRRAAATRDAVPGVGLGLSVARRIVEAHGGRIDLASEPARGTTVTVRLPAMPRPAHELHPAP